VGECLLGPLTKIYVAGGKKRHQNKQKEGVLRVERILEGEKKKRDGTIKQGKWEDGVSSMGGKKVKEVKITSERGRKKAA